MVTLCTLQGQENGSLKIVGKEHIICHIVYYDRVLPYKFLEFLV